MLGGHQTAELPLKKKINKQTKESKKSLIWTLNFPLCLLAELSLFTANGELTLGYHNELCAGKMRHLLRGTNLREMSSSRSLKNCNNRGIMPVG